MGSPDNAEYAGPWMLLYWPAPRAGCSHIRVSNPVLSATVIDLTDNACPWAVASWSFGRRGRTLALTLEGGPAASPERLQGAFDMATGAWTPEGGGAVLTPTQWHSAYAGKAAPDSWPPDPFVHARG